MLRASFEDEDTFVDDLELVEKVNEAFRDLAARGRAAPLVFVEAESSANAYKVKGRYRVEGEVVKLRVRVIKKGKAAGAFEVEGQKDALAQLVSQVVEQVQTVIANNAG